MKTIRYSFEVLKESIKSFLADECFYKTSTLTFYTLLSIVPILAVAFGIAKGFGFEQHLKYELKQRLLDQPLLADQIIQFAYSALEHTHGGLLAMIGLFGLLWTSIQLISTVQYTLNAIWKVNTYKSYAHKSKDALITLMFCLIFFTLSSVISVFTITQLGLAFKRYPLLTHFLFIVRLFPLMIDWLLFSFLYFFLPRAKVRWKDALIAGVLAGSCYHVVQWIYIHFQIGVGSYGAIYGSFAALPLFLIWINTSWAIVLMGAEIANQLEQTVLTFGKESTLLSEKEIGFLISALCKDAFLKGKAPLTGSDLSLSLGISPQIVRQLAAKLCEAGILTEDVKQAYLPVKNPQDITIQAVLEAMDNTYYKKHLVLVSPEMTQHISAIKRGMD